MAAILGFLQLHFSNSLLLQYFEAISSNMLSAIYKNPYFQYKGLLLLVFKEKWQFWKIAIFTAIMAMYGGARTEIINNDGISRLFLAKCQVQFTKTPTVITTAFYW